jgi:hypothetical protein
MAERAGIPPGGPFLVPWGTRTTEASAGWGIPFIERRTYLLRSLVADAKMSGSS